MRPFAACPSSQPSSRCSPDGAVAAIAAWSAAGRSPPTSRRCDSRAAASFTARARPTRCGRGRWPRLQTERLHRLGWIAVALRRTHRERLVEAPEVVVGELNLRRGHVLLDVLHALRTRDRDDVLAAAQDPGDRDLARLDVVLAGDLLDHAHELHVLVERLALEARVHAAEVALVEVVGA